MLPTAIETPVYEPVDDATFRGLLSHYTHDRRPVRGEVLERVEASGWVQERVPAMLDFLERVGADDSQ